MTRLVAYQVSSDGNWDPVAFSKRNLRATEVFIIVDDERRQIWIWIGMGATVKTRFISSTAATEIRRHYGLTYRVRTADQGDEPQSFHECINSIPKEGIVPELNDSSNQSRVMTEGISQSSAKTKLKKSTTETTTNLKVEKALKKTTSSKGSSKKSKPKKTTKPRKAAPTQNPSTGSKSEQKDQESVINFFPARTDIITTPPCPECKNGYLLPYSECIEEKGKEVIILPFAKWVCSKCNYIPSTSV